MTLREIKIQLKVLKKYRKQLRRIVTMTTATDATIDDLFKKLNAMSDYYEEQKTKEGWRAAEIEMENHFEE